LLRSYIFALLICLDGVHGENFVSFTDVTCIANKNTQLVVGCYLCMDVLRDEQHKDINCLIYYSY
jgi:hypothetical protein